MCDYVNKVFLCPGSNRAFRLYCAVTNSCLLWTSAPSQGFWAKPNASLWENRPRWGKSQQWLPSPALQEVQLEGPLPWHSWQVWWHGWHCFLSSNFDVGQFKMQRPSSKTLEEKQAIRIHLGDFSEGPKNQNMWCACFAVQIWFHCSKEWCLGLVISEHMRYESSTHPWPMIWIQKQANQKLMRNQLTGAHAD